MSDKLTVVSTSAQQLFIGKPDPENGDRLLDAFRVMEAPVPAGDGVTILQMLLPIISSDEAPIDITIKDSAYAYNVEENTELFRTYKNLHAKCGGIQLATTGDLNNLSFLKK